MGKKTVIVAVCAGVMTAVPFIVKQMHQKEAASNDKPIAISQSDEMSKSASVSKSEESKTVNNREPVANKVVIPNPDDIKFSDYALNVKDIQVSELPNKIWFAKTDGKSFCVSIRFKNAGTLSYDKPQREILPLIVGTLFEGAGKYSATELKQILDDNSISLTVSHDMDDIVVSCYSTTANFKLSMDLIHDILYFAHLEESKINTTRNLRKEAFQQSKELPSSIAGEELSKLELGEDSPYYVPVDERIRNLDSYSLAQIKHAYNSMFLPADAEINIAGNLEEAEVVQGISSIFVERDMQQHTDEKIDVLQGFANEGKTVHKQTKDPQIIVMFSHPAIRSTDADIYKFEMGLRILSTGALLSSRLMKEIREKQGLTYGISCGMKENRALAKITGRAVTSPDKCDQLIKSVKEQFQKIKEISQEELTRAKVSLFASKILASSGDIVSFLDLCRDMKCPVDKINTYMRHYYTLDLKDIMDTMSKYISPEKMIFVTVGDKK